jgi:hypothetical protein
MKITAFDDLYPGQIGVGGTTLIGSDGSNSGWTGGDIAGEPGSMIVTALRGVVSLQSNLASGVVLGDVLTIVSTAPVAARFSTPSNSTGSNSGGAGTPVDMAAARVYACTVFR